MPRQKQRFLLRKRKDTGYYQLKLPAWKTYRSLGTKLQTEAKDEVLRILEEEKNAALPRKARIILEEFSRGFFAQEGSWVRRRHQAGYAFSSMMSKLRSSHLEHYILPAFGTRYLEEIKGLFPPDRKELEAIWRSFFWALLPYVALTGGLRSQEIRALLWKHVIWDLRGLILVQAIKADGSIGALKSGEQRAVLLPNRTMALLETWRRETPFPGDDDYVFYGENGQKPLNKTTLSKRFRTTLIRQGFDLSKRNLVFHSLRHT
jgi:integrase